MTKETLLCLKDLRGLTRKQLAHMIENGVTTQEAVQRQALHMVVCDHPCYDCKIIIRKILENIKRQKGAK
jgi:hypothetical protein